MTRMLLGFVALLVACEPQPHVDGLRLIDQHLSYAEAEQACADIGGRLVDTPTAGAIGLCSDTWPVDGQWRSCWTAFRALSHGEERTYYIGPDGGLHPVDGVNLDAVHAAAICEADR